MKRTVVRLCVLASVVLAAVVAQAQTCSGTAAQMISPTNGSMLLPSSVTFSWCNASADYFVIIETVPGAHDIFFAFTGGQNFLTLPVVSLPSTQCASVPPTGCIPALSEPIYVTLETVKRKMILGSFQYTYIAARDEGSAVVGSSGTAKKITFTNTGSGSLTISSVRASGNFSKTDTCTGQTVPPSGTCTISVTFKPSVLGTIPGALTITDNAANSPQLVAISGQGLGQVSLAPASLSFGTVTVGASSAPKTVTLTNNTSGSLTFTFAASANYAVSGTTCTGTLASKAQCTLSVVFSPTANGAANGSLSVASASFPKQVASLSGTGSGGAASPLTFSPQSQTFSSTVVGAASGAKTVTVTNSSGSAMNISNFVASGDYSVVGSGTTPCGGTLDAGASCTVAVKFSPSIPGVIKGSVAFMDNTPVNTQLYNLSGTGVLPVSFSPTILSFAGQAVGTKSSPQTIKLTNNQAIALNVSNIAASGQYTASAAGGTCGPLPVTVSAHGSCTFAVTFSPKQLGAIPGVVTVTHNASGNPRVVGLAGNGQ